MNCNWRRIGWIWRRELHGYFGSPLAYVFVVIFLVLCGFATFNQWFGAYFQQNSANLGLSFFRYHPILFLLLVPAVAMRLWAEERKSGTIELLLTLPLSLAEAVIGKFLAAWTVLLLCLGMTFPVVVTTAWLGDPDWGPIWSGYIGSALLAGSYLALGSLTSALTRSQVISFVLSLVLCFLLYLIGHPAITEFFSSWAPVWLLDVMGGASSIAHFDSLQRGVVDVRDLAYFVSLIAFALAATGIVLHSKRGA